MEHLKPIKTKEQQEIEKEGWEKKEKITKRVCLGNL